MDNQNDRLLKLLNGLESERMEATVALNDQDKFSKAICAFANDLAGSGKSGYLVIGVDDQLQIAGKTISDRDQLTIAALRDQGNILPIPRMQLEHFHTNAGDVLVVEVPPMPMTPVRYKGNIWVRIGPRQAVASEAEERLLTERRISHARNFDSTPCLESALEDISIRLFHDYRDHAVSQEVIAENHRTETLQLASLRLFDLKANCPTIAGIILLGKKPKYFLPGNYIQWLQFEGTELSDVPFDQAIISGDLFTMVREIDIRLKAMIKTQMERIPDTWQEKLKPDYPYWALRELMLNAIMHRDYASNTPIRCYVFADRIEIQNPGGLYGEAKNENFPHINAYRNPVIAEALRHLGFVNQFGSGVTRAKALLAENGNKAPEFRHHDAHYFAAIVNK
jgi:ATP-dependent DNA helicase RecG